MIGFAIAGAVIAQTDAPQEIAGLVKEIVEKAEASDATYFTPMMDPHYAGKETNLVVMIRRSGMMTNYAERCTLSTNGTGRLNYHFLERGCHFQIDLLKSNDTWRVQRIWFCR